MDETCPFVVIRLISPVSEALALGPLQASGVGGYDVNRFIVLFRL